MKKLLYILLPILFITCDSEKANDCFQTSGKIVSKEVDLPSFTKIRVNKNVALILQEGAVQKVEIETGENLMNDVEATVKNGQLFLTDNNICNLTRDYNVTKVYVTAPNITHIVCSTQFSIRSSGVLNYSELNISSEDFNDPTVLATGIINLNVNSQTIRVVGNNLTFFTLSGVTNNLAVNLAAGDGVFDGGNLNANIVQVYHRSSNKIIVNPQQKLTGQLRSTGNLIAKNHPPIVDVVQYYTGKLIFE